ncbi:uncharacterized protein LOC130622584 [Hydractinia symbiolongicarpus]|uniref:uncharacterized protein LOC130622584 n=1 Tax=Hydractinia symbiolongicarpus TaxID=13093 RepID=UPI00254CFC43|nr:uncharacterized protein LOC130622584 [Hydractinia symbiolongicarpus]
MPALYNDMNKENIVKGLRKAKPAPDFSKIHKQWNNKLQKGKAISKKPLTDANPFQFSHPNIPKSGKDDFFIDADAKKSILNCEGISKDNPKHRVTIADTRRNSLKTQIPRASFLTKERSSLYSKPLNKSVLSKPSIQPSPLARKVNVPKPTSIAKSPARVKQQSQGFEFKDFTVDDDALESILNCKGIPLAAETLKLSSQYGPCKSNRVKGRIVPYQGSVARLSQNGRRTQFDSTSNSLAAKKQRWSIYSRDSFSAKPDLMTWLKELNGQPAPKRNSLYTKPNAGNTTLRTNSTSDFTIPTVTQPRNSFYSQAKNNTARKNLPDIEQSGPSEGNNFSLKFDKTLVGYQGDSSDIKFASSNSDVDDHQLFTTPMKNRLTVQTNESTVKSILKKKVDVKSVQKEVDKTCLSLQTKAGANTPLRTPLRFSAYARNQRLLGLPLPKENRYETLGEHITAPQPLTTDEVLTPSKLLSYQSPTGGVTAEEMLSTVKRVRWADTLKEQVEEIESTCTITLPPAEKPTTSMTDEVPVTTSQCTDVTATSNDVSNSHDMKKNTHTVSPKPIENLSWGSILSADKDKPSALRNLSGQFNNTVSAVETSLIEIVDVTKQTLKPPNPTSKTLKTSRKNKNRNSILERIYGDGIAFAPDDTLDETKMNTITNSAIKSRPTPALDKKLVDELTSSKNDSEEEGEDYFDFYSSNTSLQPFQSTMLATPSTVEVEYKEPLLMDFTPLNESSVSIPNAPCRSAKAKARTPYKQAMLDYLDKMLGLPKTNDMHDCTIVAQETVDSGVSEKVDNDSQNDHLSSVQHKHSSYEHAFAAIESLAPINSAQTLVTSQQAPVTSPQAFVTSPQAFVTSPQAFVTSPQAFVTSPQAVVTSPQAVVTSPQAFVTSPQAFVTSPQAVVTSPQAVVTSPQAVVTSPQAVVISPQAVVTSPQAPVTSPQAPVTSQFDTVADNRHQTNEVKLTQNVSQEVSRSSTISHSPPSHAISFYSPSSRTTSCDSPANRISTAWDFPARQTDAVCCTTTCQSPAEMSLVTSPSGLVNILSPSMRKFPDYPFSNPTFTGDFSKMFLDADKKSRRRSDFTSVDGVSVLKPASFQLNSLHLNEEKKKTNDTTSHKKSEILSTQSSARSIGDMLKPSILSASLNNSSATLTRGNNRESISCVTSASSHPLFGAKAFFANDFQVGTDVTYNDSSIYEDVTDMCVVFSKPFNEHKPGDTSQKIENMKQEQKKTDILSHLPNIETADTVELMEKSSKRLNSSNQNLSDSSVFIGPLPVDNRTVCRSTPLKNNVKIGLNSAFRRVPPTCNIFPRVHTSLPRMETSTEMLTLRHLAAAIEKYQRQRSSMLDAEISLYSKFGEISERFGKRKTTLRDGATCALATLLTHGDDMHFVPVDAS